MLLFAGAELNALAMATVVTLCVHQGEHGTMPLDHSTLCPGAWVVLLPAVHLDTQLPVLGTKGTFCLSWGLWAAPCGCFGHPHGRSRRPPVQGAGTAHSWPWRSHTSLCQFLSETVERGSTLGVQQNASWLPLLFSEESPIQLLRCPL